MSTNNILKTKNELTLIDSISSIPKSQFIAQSDLIDSVSATVQGAFNSTFVQDSGKRRLLVGYENFYATAANTFPALVSYDTTNDQLTEVSRVYCRNSTGLSNSVVSASNTLRYGASSTYAGIYVPGVPFLPNTFSIELHTYDANGVFSQSPSVAFNLKQLDVDFYDATISYNGLAGISTDGEYLIATYATGSIPGLITGQKLQILKVAADCTALSAKAKIETPVTNIPNMYSFPQGAIMWKQAVESTKYNIISAMNSWNFSNPLGKTSQMAYYVYDTVTDTLELKSTEWVSQYIQGFDVNITNSTAYSVTNSVSENGISILQNARAPFNNPAVDKSYELKLWKIDENAGTISYSGGTDMNRDGVQIRSSHDGKTLAVTSSPAIANDVFITSANPLSPIANRYGPSIVKTYKIAGDFIEDGDTAAASPLAFGLAWTDDDSILAVSGQATFRQISLSSPPMTSSAGMKSDQLYTVAKAE